MTTRCVCPMGGDRDCPSDCPIAVWANLSPADRKTQRKPVAEKLYKQNFTMEQIATQLGVSHPTIVRDLREFVHDEQIKPTKTASNPKGAGRPKGSKATGRRGEAAKFAKAREIVRPRIEADVALKTAELEQQHGISKDTFERAALAEQARKEAIAEKTALDPSLLSKSAQEKLDAAIRQHKRKLDIEFTQRVHDEVRRRIDDIVLPHWKDQIEEAKGLYDRRRALMTKETFNTIRRGLHPDSRGSISDKKLAEAFDAFMRLEKYLLDEKDSPTEFGGLPSSLAEWDRMRTKGKRQSRPTAVSRR